MQALATRRWWLDATEIWTERLVLRAISPADAAEVRHALWSNHDHLAPWIDLPGGEPTGKWMSLRIRRLVDEFVSGEQLIYTARTHAGGELLGCFGLTAAGAAWELSYWLAAAHTRQGYAREAATALVRLAFARGGAHRVRLECQRTNVRSAKVARAVGFERTGVRDGVEQWTLTRRPGELDPHESRSRP
jgi:RimJ/RimL family protein N-acetyltransferase